MICNTVYKSDKLICIYLSAHREKYPGTKAIYSAVAIALRQNERSLMAVGGSEGNTDNADKRAGKQSACAITIKEGYPSLYIGSCKLCRRVFYVVHVYLFH